MPRGNPKVPGDRPYAPFADAFAQWTLAYKMQHVPKPLYQRDLAEATGIDVTFISKLSRGRDIPTTHQCLRLARFFDVDVQEVLRAAGYPDIAGLIATVANDPRRGMRREKEYMLNWLQAAQTPQWQQLDWHTSAYKERADAILALDLDPFEKARWYADTVYNWAVDPQRSAPRADRVTYEHAAVLSGG